MKLEAKQRLVAWSALADAANLYQKAHNTIRSGSSSSKSGSSLVKEAKVVLDQLEKARSGYSGAGSKGNVDHCDRLMKVVNDVIKQGNLDPIRASVLTADDLEDVQTDGGFSVAPNASDNDLETKLDNQILDASHRLMNAEPYPMGFFH